MSTLKNHILLRHPWSAAIIGFLSIYTIWAIPALFLWNNGVFSYAYIFGDRIVLPLFNALAFYLISKSKQKNIYWAIGVVVSFCLAIGLVLFFEPDASSFLKAGSVNDVITAYHSAFITLEFAFIIFMCWVYPNLPRVFNPWPAIAALVLLIECFLILVFVTDDYLHDFPLWEKALTMGLLGSSLALYASKRIFFR